MKVIELNFQDIESKNKAIEFLDNLDNSVIHQYPYIKELYENDEMYKFYYLICEDKWGKIQGVLPFLIYKGELGNVIQSNPMIGYGGIVAKDEYKKQAFKCLIDKMILIGQENSCITATIGTSILDDNLELYEEIFKPDFKKANVYQYNTLDDLPLNKISSKRRNEYKRKIKAFESLDFKLIFNDRNMIDDWYDIYKKRFHDISANTFPKSLFEGIFDSLVLSNHGDFVIIKLENDFIGGAFCFYNKNVVDWYIGVFDTKFMELNPNIYLLNILHKLYCNKKIRLFNWESSPTKNGVYEFKRRWGAKEKEHYYITKILCKKERLYSLKIEEIKKFYKGIYVAPYDIFQKGE